MMFTRPATSMQCMIDVEDRLDAHSYPATTDELIDAYGGIELLLPNGTETFGDALGRIGSHTVESADAARLVAYSAVGDAAIGRKGYSDRDPTAPGETGHDQVSL